MTLRPVSRPRPSGQALVVAFALATALPLHAGEPPSSPPSASPASGGTAERPVTLAEALELARVASPRLAQLDAQAVAADAGARGARADRGPSLTLTGGYSRNSNVPEFVVPQPDGTDLVVFPNLPNQAYLRAGVSQSLYTGGRLSAAVESTAQGGRRPSTTPWPATSTSGSRSRPRSGTSWAGARRSASSARPSPPTRLT
jgi:hypothetical protein